MASAVTSFAIIRVGDVIIEVAFLLMLVGLFKLSLDDVTGIASIEVRKWNERSRMRTEDLSFRSGDLRSPAAKGPRKGGRGIASRQLLGSAPMPAGTCKTRRILAGSTDYEGIPWANFQNLAGIFPYALPRHRPHRQIGPFASEDSF